ATVTPLEPGGTGVGEPRRFKYNFGATLRAVYDDNINISSFDRISDYYFTIEPFISFGLGDDPDTGANFLTFIYRPSIFLFLDHSENDGVQHVISLQAARRFSKLSLSLSQTVQILDGQDLNSISDTTG